MTHMHTVVCAQTYNLYTELQLPLKINTYLMYFFITGYVKYIYLNMKAFDMSKIKYQILDKIVFLCCLSLR